MEPTASSRNSGAPESLDWKATSSTPLTRNAVLSVMSLGVFCVLLALQVVFKMDGFDPRVAWMVAVGVAAFAVGRRFQVLLTPRRAVEGALVGAVAIVSGLLWFIWCMFNGWFSLLALAVVPHAALTMVMCLLSLDPARRADAARARLRRSGFEV